MLFEDQKMYHWQNLKMSRLFIKFLTRLLSSNIFAKLLFGVDCGRSTSDYQIGFSTILMKKALKKYVKNNDKVLDIGTGACAIHGIWLRKNINANVTATEIDDKCAKSARIVAKHNKSDIRILKSDLFKNVKGNFDWAVFNPPFRDMEDNNGYKIVERFLKESPRKTRMMIVVNVFYVNQKKIEEIIKENNYRMIDVVAKFLNPSKVYVVEKAL